MFLSGGKKAVRYYMLIEEKRPRKISTVRDLEVYRKASDKAMDIFE
jgi:hypothetical protein